MGKKKTYRKKRRAQNARRKGETVYKVKGGYRIRKTKKRRR